MRAAHVAAAFALSRSVRRRRRIPSGVECRCAAGCAARRSAIRAGGRACRGPRTMEALIAFQSRAGLEPDGVVGPRTRRALGRHGKHPLGSRRLTDGAVGWDVAELQFLLAWHGFPSGPFDGAYGSRLAAAVCRFQRFRTAADRRGGAATIAAARTSRSRRARSGSARRLTRRLETASARAATHSMRGRLHRRRGNGRRGRRIGCSRMGRPARDVRQRCRHRARGDVRRCTPTSRGSTSSSDSRSDGRHDRPRGSTGRSSGPHLHFEVHVGGASVDPRSAFG